MHVIQQLVLAQVQSRFRDALVERCVLRNFSQFAVTCMGARIFSADLCVVFRQLVVRARAYLCFVRPPVWLNTRGLFPKYTQCEAVRLRQLCAVWCLWHAALTST